MAILSTKILYEEHFFYNNLLTFKQIDFIRVTEIQHEGGGWVRILTDQCLLSVVI